MRLDATTTLLALAGVRPADGVEEEKPVDSEQKRPAVLLNLFLGGGDEKPIRVIEGQARDVSAPVRLAGEVVRAIAEPGFRHHKYVRTEKRPDEAGTFLIHAP